MCKYCERFNGDANNYLDRQKIDLLEGRGINQEMFLMEDQNNPGNFYLQICNNLTNEVVSSVKLEYCPFCRRKLNKALEDMSSEELVENAWASIPPLGYEDNSEPAWKKVPAYTGFTGSTLANRWGAEYAAQSWASHTTDPNQTSVVIVKNSFADEYNDFIHAVKQNKRRDHFNYSDDNPPISAEWNW
jgi:hypothetical protein